MTGADCDTRAATPTATLPGQAGTRGVWGRVDRRDLARTAVVALFAAGVGALYAVGAPRPLLATTAVVGLLVGCWPIMAEAWEDVRERRMSMESSMLVAIAAAAAIGAWVTALAITAFVLAAEILEDLSLDRGRDALTDLMAFLPSTVQLRAGSSVTSVPLSSVVPDQVVVISPGGSVPVDGTVVAGQSSLDQSRITGESMPVDVQPGSSVYAGSVNQFGALQIRAERVGAESSYGQIVETVRAAQSSRPPAQRWADRFAAWLVYLALIGAAATFVVTRDLRATISVVVVAGACGIAAGTPLASLAAIGRSARSGAFIKAGTYLERLSTIDTVVFDKTGTLTTGAHRVTDVRPAPGITAAELLAAAGGAEWYSEHPIGRAVLDHAAEHNVPIHHAASFDYQPGYGVTGRVGEESVRVGNTRLVPEAGPAVRTIGGGPSAVHVAIGDRYAGSILVSDTVRDSACQCVADLHRLGLRVVMITGDNSAAAQTVAQHVGIRDVHAELLPADKVDCVQALRAQGHRLAMVGDGVNDAPSLAEADVGIAMGTGTHIARETADVVLITADLADLTRTLHIARRARRIVLANFIGTIVVDLIGMVLAALGILGPVLAAVVHVGSESAFILNSARLIPGGRNTRHATDAEKTHPAPRLAKPTES
ncbi:MAG TPA: cation-translocating P-type ATPase [Segeticoccus sp.]|uniref:heavy metal translocating P-type ATPase n=1 Tax=Segeticoccus sp. TaxID=2706531 RepID=UPI002D7E1E2D|nr:cation-translocating P-type ATPase [Segeticoccus sp.]HET8599203.1 cation-translocating P-type ATPase [Segeticoccus sp.]